MMQNNPAPALLRFIFSSLLLGMMAAYGVSLLSVDVPIDLQARYLPPGASHWFGTDNMGRDLWLRCFQGALTSLQIGVGCRNLQRCYCDADRQSDAYPSRDGSGATIDH
ncbi:peptide ABC transporter permease [Klebsiella pneumoniae]|nr:peptide ABC transporter permease [Klebsiella pneumoniae]